MTSFAFTRRHFFYGSLLAGAVPAGGFGSAPSLKAAGFRSPNEKLNIASIGAGGRAADDIRGCQSENIVACAKGRREGRRVTGYPYPTGLHWVAPMWHVPTRRKRVQDGITRWRFPGFREKGR